MPNAVVYVVDDDKAVRETVVAILEHSGICCVAFASAEDFLAAYNPEKPQLHCLILDLKMPGMGGLELQAKLQEKHCRIRTIFMSGYAETRTVVQAMQFGAVDFLEKPLDQKRLLACVTQVLQAEREEYKLIAKRGEIQMRLESLTPREREVLNLLASGKSTKEIAAILDIRPKTVFVHRARVLEKMTVESLVELTLLMTSLGDDERDPIRA